MSLRYHVKATVDDPDACTELFDSLHGYKEKSGSHSNGTEVGVTLNERGAAKDLAWRWLMHDHVTGVSVTTSPDWAFVL